jgi:hypothetical protein
MPARFAGLLAASFIRFRSSDLDDLHGLEKRRQIRLRIFYLCAATLLGFLQAWASRDEMNPDGVSYLDIGDAFFRGDWTMAISSYWSPLYPFFLGLITRIIKPSPYREFAVVHMANLVIYLFALACFDFFLRTLIAYQQRGLSSNRERVSLSEQDWLTLGFALFTWSSLRLITLQVVNPDLCLSAFLYLAAAALIRVRGGDARWSTFGFLGMVLGLGYLVKAPMFPLAVVFLGTSLFAVARAGRAAAVPRFLLGVLVFGLVAGPCVFAISRPKGRFTFGDSGRLNYAEYVNGVTPFAHWQGEGKEIGTPKHPTRKIFDSPPVYEFATPIRATYPPWYDQSYWYEGVRPRFDLKRQLEVLGSSAAMYAEMLVNQASLMTGFLALLFCGWRGRSLFRDLSKQWHLLIPTVVALTMFGIVHLETRYVGALIVVLWVGLFSGISIPKTSTARRMILCVSAAIAIVLSLQCIKGAVRDLITIVHPAPHVQWQVAQSLRGLGIRPGDKVAAIGWNFGAYWARLARVSIIAEVPYQPHVAPGEASFSPENVDKFWESSSNVRSRVMEKFAQSGARAVVAEMRRPEPPGSWIRIDHTAYCAYVFPEK